MAAITPNTDANVLARAKRDIDLPGFLAALGWQSVAGHDSRLSRSLRGPDGSHIVVSRASDSHWVWFRDGEGTGGSIVDALQQLLGISQKGRVMGILRRALASPPPPLPVATGNCRRIQPAAFRPTQTYSAVGPLDKLGRAYLVEGRHLKLATVQRFVHDLRENEMGSVRACHNAYNDGEERGPGWKSFVGGQHLGTGRGRSIWRSRPSGFTTARILMVAESFIGASSAWESLDDDVQQRASIIASTAGSISTAGIAKLEKLIAWMRGKASGEEIWLYDASDNGEAGTEQRLADLRELAARAGAAYERFAPPADLKDWNDYLARAKGLSPPTEAQATTLTGDVADSKLVIEPETENTQTVAPNAYGSVSNRQPSGRGRG